MATNQVIPPLPKGFVLESEIPPLPKGFVLEDDSDIKVDTVKTKVEEPKKEKPDKVEPGLRVAPEPTFGQKFKSFIRGMFEDDLTTNVKSQMIYQISKDTGKSLQEVSKDYNKLIRDPKITGIRPEPTVMESAELAFTGAVAAGLSTNPITTGLGVATFMALDEAENAIISGVTEGKYEFGGGKNIADLLPEDATRTSREVVEILDFIGKGMVVGKITPKARQQFKKASEFVTKQFIKEYKMPKTVYMDANKVKSILRGSDKDVISKSEKDLLLDLNLKGPQYRKAIRDGISIEIPAEKVTKMVDRPWWGQVKEVFKIPKTDQVIGVERFGERKQTVRGLLKEPEFKVSETQELNSLVENFNSTYKRLFQEGRTNTQLLQDQKAILRLSKLIKEIDPKFEAPEIPFESDLNQVDGSSLRQANIDAIERNQHFSETKAAKERVEGIEKISRADITQFMRNAFKATIRGKATNRMKGVAGFFRPDKKTVRSKVTDDIYVLSHEIAHFIDNKIWGTQPKQRPHFKPWQQELGRLDYDQTKLRTSEGFAEFIRHFVSTGKAQELAPNFYDWFTNDFAKQNKEIYNNILKLKDLMTRYNKQGSVDRVKSQINFEGIPPEQPLIERAKDISLRFRENFIDDLAFLEDVYKREGIKGLDPAEDPLQLMRVFKGKARSKAEYAIREHTIDYVGRITGDGLVKVLKPVSKNKKELQDFLAYAYARRALSRPDIDAGIEISDAQFVFDKFDSKKFREASDNLSAFADRVLEYYVDSRGMSPETRNKIKELNPIYIPLYRFFTQEPRFKSQAKQVSGGKPIKKLKGSGRQILNPIESMVRYVENIYSAGDKTRVALALADLADRNILPGGLIEEVPPPIKTQTMSTKALQKELEKSGFGIFRLFEEDASMMPDMITTFIASKQYSGKDNIIPIYEGESVKFYEVDPRLYKMLKGLDQLQLNPVIDFMLGKPTRVLKLGAVGLNAAFSYITNPFRDLVTYSVFSKNKVPNPAAPLIGLAADLGLGTKSAKEASRSFKAMGGNLTTLMGQDRTTGYRRITADVLAQAQGGVKGNVKNIALHPIEAIRKIFEIPELAPRIAEMQSRTKAYEKIHGKDSDSAYLAAFKDAQEVTINFSKMGYISQYLNQMIPFFNPIIRGGEKLYKEAKNNPVKLLVRGISAITVPALYSWYQNKDKEWFKKLPSELKYSHIYIDKSDFSDSDDIITLPLPHELGTLFGGLPMAYFDERYEIDPKATDEALKLMIKQLNPGNPVTDLSLIKPFMLVASNKTWYGAPLETMSMQRKEIPDRYNDYTMPMAKALSRAIYDNVGAYEYASPVRIEAFLNTSTGGMTKNINDILQYTNKEIESKADIPVVGKLFLRKELYEQKPDLDFDRLNLLRQKKVSNTLNTPELKRELRQLEREYDKYVKQRRIREREARLKK